MQKYTILIVLFIINQLQGWCQQQWNMPMQLKNCTIDIKADLFTATTFMELEFYNPNNREIEGLHQFELKPGQVITAFQLDLHGKYRDGSIEEKWKATNAYNSIVGKRIDPALLTMDYADHYSLRIYPVPANGTRKVTITLQQVIGVEKNELLYFLPLNFSNGAAYFNLTIKLNSNNAPISKGLILNRHFVKHEGRYFLDWKSENILLKSPVSFSIPLRANPVLCTWSAGNQTNFATRLLPSCVPTYDIHPRKITVFWDASASLAKRETSREINFLKQFISWHNISQITIIPFNYKLLDTAVFHTGDGSNSRWQHYLQEIHYDGATQLGMINTTGQDADLVFIFTDGHNTFGNAHPKAGNKPIYCINTSSTANQDFLHEIAGASGGSVVNLQKNNLRDAILMCSRAGNWLINIRSASGRIITGQSLPIKAVGPLLITGIVPGQSDSLYLDYGNSTGIKHTQVIPVFNSDECAGATQRIDMLMDFAKITRTYSWTDMIDFGLQEKIVTPNTAYIVLERTEDYVRYNITPPKELEAECEKLNYVKRDTRFERKKIISLNEFDILNNVVNVYNTRLKKLDPGSQPISLARAELGDFKYKTEANDQQINTTTSPGLDGKVPGVMGTNTLEEVVVVGYATSKRSALTGSVGYIRSQDVFSSGTTIEQALQGRVAGVQVTNTNGFPGSPAANIIIRGSGSLNGNNQPLYILDGMPVAGNINDVISVNDIDNITVLKDNTASALYGSRASNGAIVIKSKRGKNYHYNYDNKPYKLKNMEDVEYLLELKAVSLYEKMQEYERLKNLYGDETGFYLDVAQHLFEIGLKEKALTVLMNAAESSNGNFQVLISMAWILENWSRFDQAILIYDMLLKSDPLNIYFYRDLALAYYQMGDYQQSINVLYKAISLNTGQLEQHNSNIKAILLSDLNAIIGIHKEALDLSAIPASIIDSVQADLRIDIDYNKGHPRFVSIREPGGGNCNYSNPVTKNGGVGSLHFDWYNTNTFVYQIKNAVEGKYRINANFYDHYSYAGRIPSVIRIRIFKNFGKKDQSIEIENVIMDNQYGEVEIAELSWQKK